MYAGASDVYAPPPVGGRVEAQRSRSPRELQTKTPLLFLTPSESGIEHAASVRYRRARAAFIGKFGLARRDTDSRGMVSLLKINI